MTPDQIIREEFERWASLWSHGLAQLNLGTDGSYKSASTQSAWEVWKAAWAVAEGYRA